MAIAFDPLWVVRAMLRLWARPMQVVRDDERRLVLEGRPLLRTQRIAFDRRSRSVYQQGRRLCGFGDVRHVEVRRLDPRRDDAPNAPEAHVCLYRSAFRHIDLGHFQDETDASIVAARVATATGWKVIAT